MRTSARGIASIEIEEGVVLKAYRDIVGVLTIGAGLTRHSGVIDPKPGMVITSEEATRLLALALERNYEPRVRRAMPGAKQHEFDGAVSFDFNTGRIHNASWVKAWAQQNWPLVEKGLKAYRKAGGKVVRGLVMRRQREFDMIRHGLYPARVKQSTRAGLASIVVPFTGQELFDLRGNLRQLGYDPGPDIDGVSRDAVRKFQSDHDLTVDGIIGRATLNTVQRMIDARAKAKTTATSTAAGGAGAGVGGVSEAVPPTEATWLLIAVLAIGLLFALRLAWSYRDALAVKVQSRFPRLASRLRSF